MRTKLPFTVLKYAMTLDGKTATVSGKSQWITGEVARKRVHEDRGRYGDSDWRFDGAGGQSAADLPDSGREKSDPGDCRYEASDTAFTDRGTVRAGDTDLDCDGGIGYREGRKAYEDAGCRVLSVPAKEGELDLQAMMQRLGEEKVDSVMVESGGTLAWSF